MRIDSSPKFNPIVIYDNTSDIKTSEALVEMAQMVVTNGHAFKFQNPEGFKERERVIGASTIVLLKSNTRSDAIKTIYEADKIPVVVLDDSKKLDPAKALKEVFAALGKTAVTPAEKGDSDAKMAEKDQQISDYQKQIAKEQGEKAKLKAELDKLKKTQAE